MKMYIELDSNKDKGLLQKILEMNNPNDNTEKTIDYEAAGTIPTANAIVKFDRSKIAMVMAQAIDSKGSDFIINILKSAGYSTLKDVPEEKLAELVALLNKEGVEV